MLLVTETGFIIKEQSLVCILFFRFANCKNTKNIYLLLNIDWMIRDGNKNYDGLYNTMMVNSK